MASLRSRIFSNFLSHMPRSPWTYQAPPTFIERLVGYKKGETALTLAQWRTVMEQITSKRSLPRGIKYEPAEADGMTAEWVFPESPSSGQTLLYLVHPGNGPCPPSGAEKVD